MGGTSCGELLLFTMDSERHLLMMDCEELCSPRWTVVGASCGELPLLTMDCEWHFSLDGLRRTALGHSLECEGMVQTLLLEFFFLTVDNGSLGLGWWAREMGTLRGDPLL